MITETKDIFIKDFLGTNIELGDYLQVYRPRYERKLGNTKTPEALVGIPAVWYFGQLQLNLEKGLVLHIHQIHHAEGLKEGDRELAKIGWRIVIRKTKQSYLKTSELILGASLQAFYPYAAAMGRRKLKKHGLIQ